MSIINNYIGDNSHVDYSRRRYEWFRIRDAIEGETQVQSKGQTYLPKPKGQSDGDYLSYLQRAVFYAVAERTLRMLTGMVFRVDPVLKIPDRLEPMRVSLSTEEYSFDLLCEELVREILSIGRYGMLLDLPRGDNKNVLPRIATYYADDILDWDEDFIGNVKVLTKVVLRDVIRDTDEYEETFLELKLVDGVYQYRRYGVTEDEDTGEPVEVDIGGVEAPSIMGVPINRIPFFFVGPYNMRPRVEKPPFLDLVNMNFAHYRNSADYEQALYLTSQPTPWISGNLDKAQTPETIGSASLWVLPEGSQVGFLEFRGAGIASQRQAMMDKEERMAALGARMIHDGMNRNEAVDTARMRGGSEMSLLTSAVNMATASLTMIFRLAADWSGADPNEVEVTVNRDFVETRMSSDELREFVKSYMLGGISRETLHYNLQRGEVIKPDRTVDEERDSIESDQGTAFEDFADQIGANDRPDDSGPNEG